jgi:rhodanese-related sulfurtransferase
MKKVASIAMMMFFLTPCLFTISYADDVTTVEAYNMVCDNTNVYIVDVRTDAEWIWVGHPGPNNTGEGDCLDGKVVNIPFWIEKLGGWPVGNESFIKDVNEFFEDIEDPVLITMCLSGYRGGLSRDLLESEGYEAHNMIHGFQGKRDPDTGYRTVNGWVVDGLPYLYGRSGVYPD